jgi:hypothetical protein
VILAQANLVKAQSKAEVAELVGDKGYHGNEAIAIEANESNEPSPMSARREVLEGVGCGG